MPPALEDDHDDADGRLQLLQLQTVRNLQQRRLLVAVKKDGMRRSV
jgi:hypothetical protein